MGWLVKKHHLSFSGGFRRFCVAALILVACGNAIHLNPILRWNSPNILFNLSAGTIQSHRNATSSILREIQSSKESLVLVKAPTVQYHLLRDMELSWDRDNYGNTSIARYYGKEAVVCYE